MSDPMAICASAQTAPPLTGQGISRALTLLFAVAGGAAVADLYYAQPLIDFIAHDLRAPATTAGWLVTATQIGYAVGIVLIAPLGDVVDRRRLEGRDLDRSRARLLRRHRLGPRTPRTAAARRHPERATSHPSIFVK